MTVTKKGGFNPVAAAVAGAVVGAGVAVAGAVAMSDKKNREKVKETLANAKDQAVSYVEDMQKTAQVKKDELAKKFARSKKEVQKVANSK